MLPSPCFWVMVCFRAIQNVCSKVPIWSHLTTTRVLCPGTWGLIIMTHPQYHQSKVHWMCACVHFWMCKSSQQLLTTRVPYLFLITSFISLLFKGKQCIERRLSALQSWAPSMSSARQQLHHLGWQHTSTLPGKWAIHVSACRDRSPSIDMAFKIRLLYEPFKYLT